MVSVDVKHHVYLLTYFKTKLIERGYKIQEIDQYFNEALLHDRKSLLADRPKNNKIPQVYITKYHPHLKNLRKALTKGWDRIKNSHLQQRFPNPPTIAFQRNINIKEMLTSKLERRKGRGEKQIPPPPPPQQITHKATVPHSEQKSKRPGTAEK